MAAAPGVDLADRGAGRAVSALGVVRGRLADRARVDVPDRPLRTVRAATGCHLLSWSAERTRILQDARAVPVRSAPAHARFYDRVLVCPRHDRRPAPVRGRDDRLHPHRTATGGARPGRLFRRAVRAVPTAGADVVAVAVKTAWYMNGESRCATAHPAGPDGRSVRWATACGASP